MSESCPHCHTVIPANLPVGYHGRCRCGVYTYCIVLHHTVPEGSLEWQYRRQQGLPVVAGVPYWTRLGDDEVADRKERAGVLASKDATIPAQPEDPPVIATASPIQTGNLLNLSGDIWEVRFEGDGEARHFKDRADSFLRHLARLLAEPNHRFTALGFYPPPPGASPLPYQGRDESSDDRALSEYRQRLVELVQEIKDADNADDTELAARLREEFDELTRHCDGEKGARKRGHKKRCGALSPAEKADQALRVALGRWTKKFRNKGGLPQLADHLEKYLNNSSGEWLYAPPPGTSPWHVTRPEK